MSSSNQNPIVSKRIVIWIRMTRMFFHVFFDTFRFLRMVFFHFLWVEMKAAIHESIHVWIQKNLVSFAPPSEIYSFSSISFTRVSNPSSFLNPYSNADFRIPKIHFSFKKNRWVVFYSLIFCFPPFFGMAKSRFSTKKQRSPTGNPKVTLPRWAFLVGRDESEDEFG